MFRKSRFFDPWTAQRDQPTRPFSDLGTGTLVTTRGSQKTVLHRFSARTCVQALPQNMSANSFLNVGHVPEKPIFGPPGPPIGTPGRDRPTRPFLDRGTGTWAP